MVSDLYHSTRDITYDFVEKKVEAIIGTGNTETTAREIFDIPEKYGPLDKVIYINGKIKEKTNREMCIRDRNNTAFKFGNLQ